MDVPDPLRDAHYNGAKNLGRGQGYQYAHDHDEGYVTQNYGVPRGTYYHPTDRGKEAEFRDRLERFTLRDANAPKPQTSGGKDPQ